MKMILKRSFLFLATLLFIACGEHEDSSQKATIEPEQANSVTVTLSGKVTYDFIPFRSDGISGLDYNNITKKPVRGAVVEVIDRAGKTLKRTNTNAEGKYSATVTSKQVKVRVLTKLYQAKNTAKASWDFQVKDNTNGNALYAMDGKMVNLGENATQTRNLHAGSGWDGNSYSHRRVAAPFSIIDVAYQAITKVKASQSDVIFPPLEIFWSKNNIAASGNRNLGQITTSHYDGTALYILGKANSDTDEYDTAVVAHEWGHYYESSFSRSDSIGGAHGNEDMLDIRVAFGEGFGTAIGCMIIDSSLYLDSFSFAQSESFRNDLEKKTLSSSNPGWFNEASIYRILYDIYDTNDDNEDKLSLGFTPIHKVFINAEKNTPAFTSIFTFITALKEENPDYINEIDAITLQEQIQPITDIYGTGRANRGSQNANPLYAKLRVGSSVDIVTNYSATATSTYNKLGTYNFVNFKITSAGTYTISINNQTRGSSLDPDFFLYKGASNIPIAQKEEPGISESVTKRLSIGTYRMAIIVYDGSNISNTPAKFNITLTQN